MSRLIGIILVFLVLVSCKDAEENGLQSDDRYGGTAHINVPDNIYSLVPNEVSNDSEWFIASQMYETIVKMDSDVITPNSSLVKSIRQIHPDTIQYQFQSEIVFSNGSQLDSLSISEWVNQLKVNGLNCNYQQSSKSLAVFDTNIEEANARLSQRENCLFAVESGIPVGTGPFALQSINEDISIDLKKNLNYHNPALPYLDAIEVRMIKTKDTEVEEFINGSLDLIRLNPLQRLQFENVLSLDNHPNYQITPTGQKTYSFALVYNMDSLEAYQLGKALNNQPEVFEMYNKPRRLKFPNLSKAKIKASIAIDSDNSTFSQLTVESLIKEGIPLNVVDSALSDQKAIYLTTGELGNDGMPLLEAPSEAVNTADYLIILNSWSGLAVYQYYLKSEDQTDRSMIDLKSVYFKRPIKLE
ncbi:MAG: ABC transporter substrate-binding protein [Cyclobacteriaceae bacterium]